jgi:anaerobic ribonucleoside-triphosphate reductase activating protein
MSEILKFIDVLCDGEYIEELRDVDLYWVGSKNQNVINVKKRIEQVSNLK